MGWSAGTTAKMAKRYGHIGATVQRAALDALALPPTATQDETATNKEPTADSAPTS